jgi:TolB-like protein
MNAHVEFLAAAETCEASMDAVRLAVRSVLASPIFARAPRMCDLLSYLIDKKLEGREGEISEYAIGLQVFRRDAQSYDTFLDPVVRVQMGRLRSRLASYYLAGGSGHGVRIRIPPGTYVPAFEQVTTTPPRVRGRHLELLPLRDLTEQPVSHGFVAGVDEELGNRLFQAFGNLVQVRSQPSGGTESGTAGTVSGDAAAPRRLEGSIRVEHNRVRASVRLVDVGAGRVAWLSQFDCSGELGIRLQEELAGAICDRLQFYLAG